MIILYGFAPAFALPSPGPFVIKTEVQLRMMNLDYCKRFDGMQGAPKGKLPYIDDCGTIVADSTFIRDYLERKYARDLDAGLNDVERARMWAIERLAEDQLYWATVHLRWAVDKNFWNGPAHFFDHLPDQVQEELRQKQRAKVIGYLRAQGLGLHNQEEIETLARRGYAAVATLLGSKPYLSGDRPCGADAAVFAQIVSALSPWFKSGVRDAVAAHSSLVAYCERMMTQYFPGFVWPPH